MINENAGTFNRTREEEIELNRQAVESGSFDMKFVNSYMKKDFGVKLARKGRKVIVVAA